MKKLGFILIALFAVVVGLLVGTLNSDPVQLDLLWIQFELPLGLALLLGFSVGVLTGTTVLYMLRIVPLRMKLRKARGELSKKKPSSQQDSPNLTLPND